MGHDKSTRLRIKLGSLDLEFEGEDDFLRSEVPKLLKTTNDLQLLRISPSLNALTRDVNESLAAEAVVKKVLDEFSEELDKMGDSTEQAQMRLQMMMDRMRKALETLSNVLKKMSETSEQVVQNLK